MFDDRVRERDLDHFLIEELQASTTFRSWFLDRLRPVFTAPPHVAVSAQRSPLRQTDTRQTDVLLAFLDAEKNLVGAILIESKVTADFQDGQPEAYMREAEALRGQHGRDHAAAVIVAPAANTTVLRHTCFHASISLESMAGHIEGQLAGDLDAEARVRLEVKRELLEALCGKRPNSRWTPQTIGEKRSFADAYAALVKELAPELEVRTSTDGPKAFTRFFDRFPGKGEFPYALALKHEFGNGEPVKYANLQFTRAGHLMHRFKSADRLFPADGSIYPEQSPTSLMICIRTPGLVPDGAMFDEQREKVVEGIRALKRLCDWLVANSNHVLALLTSR